MQPPSIKEEPFHDTIDPSQLLLTPRGSHDDVIIVSSDEEDEGTSPQKAPTLSPSPVPRMVSPLANPFTRLPRYAEFGLGQITPENSESPFEVTPAPPAARVLTPPRTTPITTTTAKKTKRVAKTRAKPKERQSSPPYSYSQPTRKTIPMVVINVRPSSTVTTTSSQPSFPFKPNFTRTPIRAPHPPRAPPRAPPSPSPFRSPSVQLLSSKRKYTDPTFTIPPHPRRSSREIQKPSYDVVNYYSQLLAETEAGAPPKRGRPRKDRAMTNGTATPPPRTPKRARREGEMPERGTGLLTPPGSAVAARTGGDMQVGIGKTHVSPTPHPPMRGLLQGVPVVPVVEEEVVNPFLVAMGELEAAERGRVEGAVVRGGEKVEREPEVKEKRWGGVNQEGEVVFEKEIVEIWKQRDCWLREMEALLEGLGESDFEIEEGEIGGKTPVPPDLVAAGAGGVDGGEGTLGKEEEQCRPGMESFAFEDSSNYGAVRPSVGRRETSFSPLRGVTEMVELQGGVVEKVADGEAEGVEEKNRMEGDERVEERQVEDEGMEDPGEDEHMEDEPMERQEQQIKQDQVEAGAEDIKMSLTPNQVDEEQQKQEEDLPMLEPTPQPTTMDAQPQPIISHPLPPPPPPPPTTLDIKHPQPPHTCPCPYTHPRPTKLPILLLITASPHPPWTRASFHQRLCRLSYPPSSSSPTATSLLHELQTQVEDNISPHQIIVGLEGLFSGWGGGERKGMDSWEGQGGEPDLQPLRTEEDVLAWLDYIVVEGVRRGVVKVEVLARDRSVEEMDGL